MQPRVWGYSYDPPTAATLTLWGAESIPPELAGLRRRVLEPPSRATCVIGQGVAEARFLGVGDRLPLKGADGRLFAPRVVGHLLGRVVASHQRPGGDAAAESAGSSPWTSVSATDLAVAVGNPDEVATVARKIQQLWPDVRTISRQQILRTYDAVFDWRGGVWAALLLSSIAGVRHPGLGQGHGLSAEEYRTLGILKAVGWRTRDVLELKLWEGTDRLAGGLFGPDRGPDPPAVVRRRALLPAC